VGIDFHLRFPSLYGQQVLVFDALTRLLVVLENYSTSPLIKERVNQLVNFHENWSAICATGGHSTTTLNFVT